MEKHRYYWVRILNGGEIAVAYLNNFNRWALAGDDYDLLFDSVTVLSGPLAPPEEDLS